MTAFVQSIITIVLFIFILGALVIIHELGHFLTARAFRVRVLEFGIGFPPRAKVMRSKGETLYTLNWLPIGGFVKLEGEDGTEVDDPRSFAAQRYLTKMAILVAGVLMNILLAFVIFTGIALYGDPTIGANITTVQPGSPAAAAGLQPGDVIVSVNGKVYNAFSSAGPTGDLQTCPARTVVLGVKHPDGTTSDLNATLRTTEELQTNKGALGIITSAAVLEQRVTYSPLEAVRVGAQRTVDALGLIVNGLGQLVEFDREPPDAGTARPGTGRHRHPDRRHLLAARTALHAVCRGHPVGQPRGRQHPAVPSARWRPDADHHAQARVREPDQRPR